jgi:hypothetical protein
MSRFCRTGDFRIVPLKFVGSGSGQDFGGSDPKKVTRNQLCVSLLCMVYKVSLGICACSHFCFFMIVK